MSLYNNLILLIILIKIIYILLVLTKIYNKVTYTTDTLFGTNILFWLIRVEFIYTFLMALLIIALFRNAIKEGMICIYDKETLFLMYVFGIMLLFTAGWNQFISESTIIQYIQNIFGITKKEILIKKDVIEVQPYKNW